MVLPLTLSNHWISLLTLLERWTTYQETIHPNQEHHEQKWEQDYEPSTLLARWAEKLRRVLKEEMSTMSYPLEVSDRLRTCVKLSRAALKMHEQDMDSQPFLCTLKTVDNPTCTWYMTVPGQMEPADASPSMGSSTDQITLRFGLVAQQGVAQRYQSRR